MTLRILRPGAQGPDVRRWQTFLSGQLQRLPLAARKAIDGVLIADGAFGPMTVSATKVWQSANRIAADGIVGPQSYARAIAQGLPVVTDPFQTLVGAEDRDSQNWPPAPEDLRSPGDADRQRLFGRIEKVVLDDGNSIRITNGWDHANIITVRNLVGGKVPGSIPFHRLAAAQLFSLLEAWKAAGLLDRILTWDGSYVPRLIRGGTRLSNHAYGTAFDINCDQNPLGARPALLGERGCVRELVELANRHGFAWGGHWTGRPDGMHFEVAKII